MIHDHHTHRPFRGLRDSFPPLTIPRSSAHRVAAAVLACAAIVLAPFARADQAPPLGTPADGGAASPAGTGAGAGAGVDTGAAGVEPDGAAAGWLDRLMWNADERTRRGADSLADKEYGRAAASMETALRLAPEDPRARFNAGTAHLPTHPEEAQGLLEGAATTGVDPTLAAKASYNLGNLHLEADRLPEAIEAYKDALRRDAAFEDAKYNLELAQRRLKERRQQQQDQQDQNQQNQDQQEQDPQQNQDQQNQDQQNQDQQDQDQQDQDQQNQDRREQDPQNQDQNQDPQDQDQPQQEQDSQRREQQDPPPQDPQQQGGEQKEESPLPQFQDLPEMSAEEAAAILEAIENMEREQRRQRALEAAKAQVGKKKDW